MLLGEYDDPFTNYANTVNRLFTTIETYNYEKEVSRLIDLSEIAGAAKYKTGSSEMTASLRSVLPDAGNQDTSIQRIRELNEEAVKNNYSDEELRKRTLEILETESGINKPLGGYEAYPVSSISSVLFLVLHHYNLFLTASSFNSRILLN